MRGVVINRDDYIALTKGVSEWKARKTETVEEAAAEFNSSSIKRRFFAFRHGAKGSRGLLIREEAIRHLVPRVRAPTLDMGQFNNITQALVFCEQAGTNETHWQTLEGALLFLLKNPDMRVTALISKFLLKTGYSPLPRGPFPADASDPPEAEEKPCS
ncbi:hypothetical protein FVE85_3609 [Porphyridium purpureum]|uniref:Uncharacterized protein n=1 Tax=Porphyridium purpureum TaxID=35688 RepID=A0A5J4YL16_PORPP|nr:hypothetical protein FVE85_3609 [Porphyridium purpureum]|eukprot:POR0550..scf249_10